MMQPDKSLADQFADRGGTQWTYGEITIRGCAGLLDALLDGSPPEEATFLDVGSGVGQIVLWAAAVGCMRAAIGIELVPSRHAVAEAARSHMIRAGHEVVGRASELRCVDALDDAALPCFERATHVFFANAVFEPALNARLVAHCHEHAPLLHVLATLKEPPADALADAGLVLVRATAVAVSWDAVGWPLYVYRRQAVSGAPPVVDAGFEAALESQTWFSMC